MSIFYYACNGDLNLLMSVDYVPDRYILSRDDKWVMYETRSGAKMYRTPEIEKYYEQEDSAVQ